VDTGLPSKMRPLKQFRAQGRALWTAFRYPGEKMLGWLREQRAYYKLGQRVAATMVDEIEQRIVGRVVPDGKRFVQVFQDQLGTIWNDPRHEARTLVRAEWQTFEERLQKFIDEKRTEINTSTCEWDEVIEDGISEMLVKYIGTRLSAVESDMR